MKNKKLIVSYTSLVIVVLIIIGATFAYLEAQISTGKTTAIDAITYTTDSLAFNIDDNIEITADLSNFDQGMRSLHDEATATATLIPNNSTGNATKSYHLYLDIERNELIHTGTDAELLLKVTGPNGLLEDGDIEGLDYVEVTDGYGTTHYGFDITEVEELIEITNNRNIVAQNGVTAIEDWLVEVYFINLSDKQDENQGKKFRAFLKIQKEEQLGLLNFKIDGVAYQARSGMTFGEWAESSYNTGLNNKNYYIEEYTEKVVVECANNCLIGSEIRDDKNSIDIPARYAESLEVFGVDKDTEITNNYDYEISYYKEEIKVEGKDGYYTINFASGMVWSDWIESSDNTDGFYLKNNQFVCHEINKFGYTEVCLTYRGQQVSEYEYPVNYYEDISRPGEIFYMFESGIDTFTLSDGYGNYSGDYEYMEIMTWRDFIESNMCPTNSYGEKIFTDSGEYIQMESYHDGDMMTDYLKTFNSGDELGYPERGTFDNIYLDSKISNNSGYFINVESTCDVETQNCVCTADQGCFPDEPMSCDPSDEYCVCDEFDNCHYEY